MSLVDVFKKINEEKMRDIKEFVDASMGERRTAYPMKSSDTIRASGIEKFCPREEAICVLRNITREDFIEPKLSKIFKMGRLFETHLRDGVLGDLGIIIGKWKCVRCTHVPDGDLFGKRYPKPKKCEKCGEASGFDYVEEFKKDTDCNVGGSTDGFIYWNNDYALLEMKTANNRRFTEFKKKGPDSSHLAQSQVYMRLHGYKKALIWYYNKDNSDEALFWIDYDSKYATNLMNKGVELKLFFEEQQIPKRICITDDCPRANDCQVRDICFKEMTE